VPDDHGPTVDASLEYFEDNRTARESQVQGQCGVIEPGAFKAEITLLRKDV